MTENQKFKPRKLYHKFGAIQCTRDDIKFPSKLERGCYDILKQLIATKEILFFLRQIPFDLPGGYIHKIDFCAFTGKSVLFIEAKGRDLIVGRMKRKQVEELFNVKIHIVQNPKEIYKVIENDR